MVRGPGVGDHWFTVYTDAQTDVLLLWLCTFDSWMPSLFYVGNFIPKTGCGRPGTTAPLEALASPPLSCSAPPLLEETNIFATTWSEMFRNGAVAPTAACLKLSMASGLLFKYLGGGGKVPEATVHALVM